MHRALGRVGGRVADKWTMPQMQSTRAIKVFLQDHKSWPCLAEQPARRIAVVPGANRKAKAAAPEQA